MIVRWWWATATTTRC